MPLVNINTLTLHYQIHGQGAPLFIIGGLGDNTRNWFPLSTQLGKHFTVVTIDNRGAGISTHPDEEFTIDDMAGDVAALATHLKFNAINVMGFSMGGKIAMRLALTHPQLVAKLILISTGPGWVSKEFLPTKEAREILKNPQNTPEHFARQYSILFSKEHQKKFPASGFVKFREMDPHPQPIGSFLRQLMAIGSCDLSGDVHSITCPTLIFAGDDDPITPLVNAQWLKRTIPNSQLKIYAGAGHVLQGERTKDFVDDVTVFLK